MYEDCRKSCIDEPMILGEARESVCWQLNRNSLVASVCVMTDIFRKEDYHD
jgi:hypothetical protein